MGSKPWLHPAPAYRTLETYWSSDDDAPGSRCSHTLTAVAATKSHGPRLILFGGVTAIEGGASSAPGIRLDGATNSVHSYDVLTRKWTRIQAAGEPPSPRAAHAAAAVGTMVVFQGGIGPAGHSTDDLFVLDLTTDKFKWHRVVVQGQGPGPRYGHVMDLVAQRYLVIVSGNDGKRALSDAWVLDTAQKPYAWQRLNPEGDRPSARMYATASARSDGMFLLCGGRDASGTALGDAYGLLMHRNGQWEWTLAPGVSPSTRYQHAAVFVGARLHVTGGALKGGRLVEGEAAVAVLDTAAGAWLDRNGIVTSSKTSKGHAEYDPSLELMRRCRHASASVGVRIYVYGGLKGDAVLDDFLVAENSPFQSDMNSPILTSERASTITSPRSNHYNLNSFGTTTPDGGSEIPLSGGISSMDKNSMEKLREASAAEAEAANAVWQAAQAASSNPAEETSVSDDNSKVAEATSDGSDNEADVRLHPRAVVVAKETVGNLGGLVRQLSLDQFENESRRMLPMNNDASYPARKFTRKKSPQGLHKKIISMLLRPRNWKAPANRGFFLDSYEVGELCYAAEQIFMQEPTVLQLKAPVKVFGDLHGQFGDLMRLFDEYGFPSTAGDITYIDYLFLGDYVDRGQHSLETITLLLALKIEYPENVHLIRGNHEAADINALFGFRIECIERMGESDGIWAWTRFNQLFNCLPLAALIEKKIICMHGGIGRSIHSVEQIEKLERPITMDAGSIILMDLLWSDPTENDSIEGLRPNARGPGLVTFGPDRVTDFCKKNKLQLIIRAHECVMDGFERFAQGQLITLFSATNYCGTANNAGAILVVGRGLAKMGLGSFSISSVSPLVLAKSNCCSGRETTARRNARWALTPNSSNLQNVRYSSRRSLCLNSGDGGIMKTNPRGNGVFVGDKDGVIIVDHGSRRKESNLMLNEFVSMFKDKTGYLIVEPAHMELAEPSIRDAFGLCVQQGANRVIMSPFFLFPGRHWHRDIPSLTDEAAKEHPGVSYIITAPLGLHELLVDVMNDRINYCLSHIAGDANECAVCVGTSKCKLY